MKKIKTACVDKLLALSSCLVITNCDKSAEDKKDGEKFSSHHINTFVDISSDVSSFLEREKNIPEFKNKTLKGVIDKNLPNLFDNSRIPIQFRQLSPRDVIDCLTKINDSLSSDGSHEDIYSILIYYNAYIRSFGIFGLRDEALIDFIGLVDALGKVCNELKNKNNLNRDIIDWFNPDSKNTTIPYGDIKKFFNDICIAFLCSKDVADLTLPSEHFLSKTELDTEKAGFLICCDQIESHTSAILKKVNDDMSDWKHSDSPAELNYDGHTSNGTFSDVKHVDTIKKKNEILATIRDSDKTCFTCKDLDGSPTLTHNNPRSINTKDHVNSIVAGLKEIEAVLTCYADKKKEINRDSEEFKENFENIDLDIERLLTALIYRGIQYNQFFVQSKTLKPLFHFTTQEKPLDSLKNALQGITEYTGKILKGILKNIFAKANEIKQVTDPHQGVVSIDLTALQNQIDVFNQKILNDRILFELAYNARRYFTDLFTTGKNADFITEVPKKITNILTNHNTNNYGNFLKGVCNFLSTWDYDNIKHKSVDPEKGPKWDWLFPKIEHNKYNNPFIFDTGKDGQEATDAAGFDFAFNDVQDILYEKYADCVLPETFLECQQLFKRTRDICVTDKKGGLFYEIANLHTNDNFKNNTSLRSLDLLKICLPINGEKEKSFYNFFNRLPNTNSEYINGAETWTIGKGNNNKKIIIGHINAIPDFVKNRQKDKTCPKIDDAIGKLTNFILIDNPNEVIDICNSKGYKQDFTEWEDINSLKSNVNYLTLDLSQVGVFGKKYQIANSKTTLGDFDFTSPKDMVKKCNQEDFKKFFEENEDAFPALFAEENNFKVETYTKFHDYVFYIERRLYYVLCCIKTLGASIPRRFLKDSGENQNLLDSYRNCRNLSLLIENALTNVLIACARPDIFKVNDTEVTGWKMLGWNDHCKLHTQPTGKTHWGQYDIFIGPKEEKKIIGPDGKEEVFYETGNFDNFSTQYSPFYSEIDARNVYAQTWEQSFLDYKSTVTNDILPISLEELKCGFFNYANRQTLIWNKTDFNNYIDSTYSRAFYDARKNPYGPYDKLQISLQKIMPGLSKNFTLTSYGDYPKDPCLLFNEKIANKTDDLSFSEVLKAYHFDDCGRKADYLSLTYNNTRKKYSFTTFGNNKEKKFETAKTHNFFALLNGVKECIDNFYKFYNDKEVFTSLQQVNFTDNKSKALLKLYLKNGLNIVGIKDYGNDFLNCFITFKDEEDLNNLKNYIINVGKIENLVNSFYNMTHRKQFYTEIYGVQDKDVVTTKKIDHYNKVFKLFNLEELQGGSVFDQNLPILNDSGKATDSYCSNFDQKLKGKVEDFFGKVHEAWCQKVMRYTTGDADKTLTEIFTMLGKTYDTLNTEVIDAVKTLKDNIKNIGDWFTRYNGNSLKNLKDCVGKIGDDMIANTALKELQDLFGTITEGTANNDHIDPTNVKDKLNDVYTSLGAVINNLPKADTDVLKSIFILKPNKGEDEIDNYKNYKYKLEENKKELDQYKTWLGNYDRTILDELKTCFDSLKNHKTSLENLQQDIDTGSYPADLQVLKTLLGKDSGVGSIKNTCKDLKEKLNNLNTEAESKKVFFGGKQDLFKDYIQTLDKALNNLPKEDPELENDLDLINSANTDHGFAFLFEDTKRQSPEQIEGRFKENFGKIYKSITLKIQSLQQCIGDIDKVLKEHLIAEFKNVKTLLDETKTTLTFLDDLTKTDNSYMGTMMYINTHKNDNTKPIVKLLAGVVGDGSGALEKVVNWKKGDANKNPFYQDLKDIENGLNNMLKAGKGNGFETAAITISAATDTVGKDGNVTKYGDRVNITHSNIIDDDDNDLTKMAKEHLFNDDVLKECLG